MGIGRASGLSSRLRLMLGSEDVGHGSVGDIVSIIFIFKSSSYLLLSGHDGNQGHLKRES